MEREGENLEFKAEVKIGHMGNSGMYFRTAFGPGFPKGYEAQVNTSHTDPVKTGSLYGFHKIFDQLIPDDVYASLEVTRVGLKGPTATPIAGGHQSINVVLRKKLGLYTNFRPVRMLPGLKTRYSDLALDLAIFRENTEDLYSGLEHEVVPGVVESLKIITHQASMRIAHAAFKYARREGRRKVTAILRGKSIGKREL